MLAEREWEFPIAIGLEDGRFETAETPIDLSQVDHALFPDGTRLEVLNEA